MKKLIALAICAMMCFACVACGQTAPTTPNATEATEAPVGAETPVEETKVDFPTRSIELVVPWAAGGGSDLVARAAAEAASEILGQNITVVNQTGGGGAVGFGIGAAAAKDGYHLVLLTTEITMVPHTSKLAFDYSSFTPILQLNSGAATIAVPADAPYDTIQDFVAYCAANPSTVTVANAGTGALWHLAAVAFEKAADVKLTHVPYNGAAEAVAAVLGGHAMAAVASPAEFAANVEAGTLKLLTVMADERVALFPDVPTAKESGYDVSVTTWRGIAVPAGTPDEIVAVLCQAFEQAAASESFISYMNNAGQVIDILDSAAFGAKMESENVLYKDILTELGLSIY